MKHMPRKHARAGDSKLDPTVVLLYDLLMSEIEPELMTTMLPELPTIYREETKAERRDRANRYAKAFAEFSRRFSLLIGRYREELLFFRKQAFASLRREAAEEDVRRLGDIERSIGNA